MAEPRPEAFDANHAAKYDNSFAKLSSFKEALHILTGSSLTGLPADARLLCVGAGTGAELLYLAAAHPGWSFTALDVSEPMLDVCKQRVEEAGWSDRCSFHVGPVDTLQCAQSYDAATSLLVSQFILDEPKRREFFEGIHARLCSGGRLVTADLACDVDSPDSAGLVETWRGALQYNGASEEELDRSFEAYRGAVAVVSEAKVASLLAEAGFHRVTRFFQAGLMHAWHARRA